MNTQNDLNIIADLVMRNFTREDWEKVKNELSGQYDIDFDELNFIKEKINDNDLLEYLELLFQQKNKMRQQKNLIHTIWKSAAVLIILATSIIVFQKLSSSKTGKELFAENYEFCPSDVLVRGEENNDDKIKASEYYNNREFEKALSLFKEQYRDNTEDHYSLLYIGLTYIECGLQSKNETKANAYFYDAIDNFKSLAETKDELFNDQALWYLSLSYLYVDDTKNALHHLTKLQQNGCVFSDKAAKLIDQLKK